jgi:dihydroflavonol-4-reductase
MSGTSVLVVGGSGLIGSHTAEYLTRIGYDVTTSSRTPLDGANQLALDYVSVDESILAALEPFDSIVFAAGQDIRHLAVEDENADNWDRIQGTGVSRFAELARTAGVSRFVQIGSYYHQLRPELVDTIPYVRARRDADDRTRALTVDGFAAITLNPPSIVGSMPGRVQRRFSRMVEWARGNAAEPELFAPVGGTNYMSVRSLAQAVAGALAAGEPGRAYLIGDENLTYTEYFQLFADAAGGGVRIVERDEEHPFQPDRFIVQGRGAVISYEPDPAEVALLGYQRNDVRRAVTEIVETVDAEPA